jgi:hypothetical protein
LIYAWGSWGHQRINNAAIFALPEEMRHFFYNHKDFITEESVVPDLRKYTINDKAEFARHYIDLEDYTTGDIDLLPKTMKEAKEKYDDKTLQKNGILVWYIQDMMDKLTKSFRDKRKSEILFLAADLGHYIGDANMPLHTSSNHDGQLTNQRGIHAFWESQIPELFGADYSFAVQPAVYIPDVTKESWNIIRHTFSLRDSVLNIERQVHNGFDTTRIFVRDANGAILKNKFGATTHTREYAQAYHNAMGGLVERQLRHAVQDLANLWYTAWVNAGKPDLSTLDPKELTDRNRKAYRKDNKLIKKGKLFGFKTEDEFAQ